MRRSLQTAASPKIRNNTEHHNEFTARRASPNASLQKAPEEWTSSTTSRIAFTNSLDLLLGHDQRRRHLEHHEVVAADLRENTVIAEQAHHQHLPEHAGVNAAEGFERDAQAELAGAPEFDARKHAGAAHGLHHFVGRENLRARRMPQPLTQPPRALPKDSCSSTSSVARPARIARRSRRTSRCGRWRAAANCKPHRKRRRK